MSTQEALTIPAPCIPLPPPSPGTWQREFEAFQGLLPGLLRTHAGQYVVIHDGQVVDSGSDELALALRFLARYGKVAVHIGLVTATPEPLVRIPHYRTPTGEPS